MKDTLITPLDNIKNLYNDVGPKVPFFTALAVHLDRSPRTLNNHWFCRFWAIPEDQQQEVIAFMQKWIANRNKVKSV